MRLCPILVASFHLLFCVKFCSSFCFHAEIRTRRFHQARALPGVQLIEFRDGTYHANVDGTTSGIGPFGNAVFKKILKDQKDLHASRPVPGFKPGTIPPFIMTRIMMATVRETCRETCIAALEENGIRPLGLHDDISLSFPGIAEDGNIATFIKSSGWKPGDAISFKATGLKGVDGQKMPPLFAESSLDQRMFR